VIASIPQDLKFAGEYSTVEIGDYVTVREFASIHRGTSYSYRTVIKNNVLVMAYVHIAHDCIIGNHVIIANAVNIAGHVIVDDFAVIGGMCAVHQFSRIGQHAMIAGGCKIRKDIPPYTLAGRDPLCYTGINSKGLKKRNFSNEDIHLIQEIYRLVYLSGLNNTQAREKILHQFPESAIRNEILNFIASSERGIMKGSTSMYPEE